MINRADAVRGRGRQEGPTWLTAGCGAWERSAGGPRMVDRAGCGAWE